MDAKLETLFDSLSDFIIVTNAEGFVTFANASLRLFAKNNQIKVKNTVFAPSTSITKHTAHPMADLCTWTEPHILDKGEMLYVRTRHETPVYRSNNEAASVEAKMRFISTISHEMRTPLNGILGMAQLLRETGIDAHQKTYVDAINNAGTALLSLINDILDYSKTESQKLELDERIFSPTLLIQRTAELLSPKSAEKSLELGYYISPNVPKSLIGDEGRLRQILLNLVSNAIKFTDTGGVIIDVRVCPHHDSNIKLLKLSVIDTGIGISPNEQETVFQEFSQATGGSAEGTGLGLTIARRLARLMKGDILIQSTLGKGSRFTAITELKSDPSTAALSPLPSPSTQPSVLVLTRSAVLRTILDGQLCNLNVKKRFFAHNAVEALEILRQNPGCALLCDFAHAQEHGKTLVETAENALVLLSPLARNHLDELRGLGFDGYLIKPIREESLGKRLAVYISKTKGELDQPANTRQKVPDKSQARPLKTDTKINRTTLRKKLSQQNAPPKLTQTRPATSGGSTNHRACRVLLAEDNQINTILASAIIKRAGFELDIVENGREALAAIQKSSYDVILMDMHMPIMTGLEAAKAIRALNAPAARLPIVALTANAMQSDHQKCLEAGMDGFLTKPFEPKTLIALIKHWYGKSHRMKKASTSA